MLTEAEVRNALPGEKSRKIFDGGGLYLEVAPNGSRWWRLKYRIDGVEKRLSLGGYPDITLKRARERRQEARRLIAEGIDPSAQRKAEKAAVQDTFEALAREYFDVKREAMAEKTFAKRQQRFEKFAFPSLAPGPSRRSRRRSFSPCSRRLRHAGPTRLRIGCGPKAGRWPGTQLRPAAPSGTSPRIYAGRWRRSPPCQCRERHLPGAI
jgi:hypothetical protein